MSEEQVLPELDEKGWTGKKCPACEGTGEAGDEKFGKCISCAGTGDEYSNIHCRERQLLTALTSLAQSEAEGERLQGELSEIMKRLHIDFHRGAYTAPAEPQPIEEASLPALIERIANLRDLDLEAALARERELHQGLRQTTLMEALGAVENERLDLHHEYRNMDDQDHGDAGYSRAIHDAESAIKQLLEDKSKPVATTS